MADRTADAGAGAAAEAEADPDGPIWALGLMSGTSMDGIDAALVKTDGVEIEAFGPGAETPLGPEAMPVAREVHLDWRRFRPAVDGPAGDPGARARLAQAETEVAAAHAAAAATLIARPDAQAPDIVGFHGQTVAHAPHEAWTWQIGDAAGLARGLNRPVVHDFRSADMRAGGQGAPLAPLFHAALARRAGATAPLAVLNLGGVGNVTWIDPSLPPEAPGALVAFDTGPANAPIDDWMRARTGRRWDAGGEAAAAGRVHEDRLARNAMAAYLAAPPPKSLDRNEYALMIDAMDGLSPEDGAATLTALSARAAAAAQAHFPRPVSRWWVCGGGRRNATLMAMIAERAEAPVAPIEAAGFDGGLLEAQAFAYLAVRSLRGLPLSVPGTTGCAAPTAGGRIARP
ncbi:MAG: anhydro-N-acetylmuramic acid kinase [Pseudomonadota bacterium]